MAFGFRWKRIVTLRYVTAAINISVLEPMAMSRSKDISFSDIFADENLPCTDGSLSLLAYFRAYRRS